MGLSNLSNTSAGLMATAAYPAPQGTPIADGITINIVWERYLKMLGETQTQAQKLQKTSKTSPLSWILQGAICYCTYESTGEDATDIALPYVPVLGFTIGDQIISAGTKSVTIPAGTQVVQWWYVATLSQ